MYNQQALLSKTAGLESKLDLLEAELSYLNDLLIKVGFPKGITTLKATVEELLAEEAEAQHVEKKTSPLENL